MLGTKCQTQKDLIYVCVHGGWMQGFEKLGGQGMGTLGLHKLVGFCRGLSTGWFGFRTSEDPKI